jgi:hypothetical protein
VSLAINSQAAYYPIFGSTETQHCPVCPNQNVGTNVGSFFGNVQFIV